MMKLNERKFGKLGGISTVVILIAVMIVLIFVGNVKVKLDDTSMTVSCIGASKRTIAYSDVNSIEYQTEFTTGSRRFGMGSFRIEAGRFSNDALGSYQLYSYKNCDAYIIVHTTDGDVVINQKTEADTKVLYDTLMERVFPK